MTRDEMKNLIERLHGLWRTGDLAAIPTSGCVANG